VKEEKVDQLRWILTVVKVSTQPWFPPEKPPETGHANGADWQEEVYQQIKSMKEKYLSDIHDEYQNIASKVQQVCHQHLIPLLSFLEAGFTRV
ncbi:hypothetical protein H5410_020104, partial [Solanum commersonii]